MVEHCDCGAEKVQFTTDDGQIETSCVFCDVDGPFYTEGTSGSRRADSQSESSTEDDSEIDY